MEECGDSMFCGLSLTFRSLFPNSSFFLVSWQLICHQVALSLLQLLAPGAVVGFTLIGSFSPSPTPKQHRHHLHIHRLPIVSVIQDSLIGSAIVYLAGALTAKPLQ